MELEEYDSRVESAPGSDVGAAVGVGIGPSVGGAAVGAAVGTVGAPVGVGLQLSVVNANNSANSGDGVAHVEPGGLSATQEAAPVSHGSGAPVADTALHHLEQALHHLEQAASDRKVSGDDACADCGTPMIAAALEMRAARAI